jgi:Protein of unknown function (DUF4231)
MTNASNRTTSTAQLENPPRPPFVLSIGVVGHKPDRLPEKGSAAHRKLEVEVARVLTEIKLKAREVCDLYPDFFAVESQSSLRPRLLTALAEGADSIAAEAGFLNGYRLEAVLPFEQENYEKDFHGDALKDFQRLYKSAKSKLVLPNNRRLPPERDDPVAKKAYEAAGLTVIGNCDIVLSVWDGGESGGRGGTTEMLETATGLGIPIIHIDAKGEDSTLIRWSGLDKFPVQAETPDALPAKNFDEALRDMIDKVVRPPSGDKESKREENSKLKESLPRKVNPERKGAIRHFNGRFYPCNPFFAFSLLMTALFVSPIKTTDVFPNGPEILQKNFQELLKPAVGEDFPRGLVQAYAAADAIGLYFAQFFRSAFVLNFFAASFAVAAALSSMLIPAPSPWPSGIEIGLISFVVLNTIFGRYFRWHTRWVEAREVAERLRVASMLWILGIRPRAFSGEEPAWTGWYVRALARAEPLRSCVFDLSQVESVRTATIKTLQNQCRYHETNAHRMKCLEHILEGIGLILLVLTALVALDHFTSGGAHFHGLLHRHFHHPWPPHEVGVALSAILPALATATYGIRVIGDFEGNAKRSERAHKSLKEQIDALDQKEAPPDLDVLRRRARAAGEAMLGDVSSWRLAAESRGLAIPG